MTGEPEVFVSPVGILVVQDQLTGKRAQIMSVVFNEEGDFIHLAARPLDFIKSTDRIHFTCPDLVHIEIIGIILDNESKHIIHRGD